MYNSYGSSYGGSYGGGYGMGGMMTGMGMPMFGMPMMMGGSGLLSYFYSFSYLFTTVGFMYRNLRQNVDVIKRLYFSVYFSCLRLIKVLQTSEFRRIIQRKCKRVQFLKYLAVILFTITIAVLSKLGRYYAFMNARARLVDWNKFRSVASAAGATT
jgi:hypothetical protein